MSQHDLANQPRRAPAQKKGLNVYTIMLCISFVTILIGCILLYVELNRFGTYPWWNTREAQPRRSTFYLESPALGSHPGQLAQLSTAQDRLPS